jgi:hypothetical protein
MGSRRHPALIPLSHDHQHALAVAFRLHHPSPPGPVTPVTPASTPATRAAEVADLWARELVSHFVAEETVLFPALRRHLAAVDPAQALVARLVDEHGRLRSLVESLATASDDAAREPLLTGFADLLEAHVRAEERQLFVRFPELIANAAEVGDVDAGIRACLAMRPAETCAV